MEVHGAVRHETGGGGEVATRRNAAVASDVWPAYISRGSFIKTKIGRPVRRSSSRTAGGGRGGDQRGKWERVRGSECMYRYNGRVARITSRHEREEELGRTDVDANHVYCELCSSIGVSRYRYSYKCPVVGFNGRRRLSPSWRCYFESAWERAQTAGHVAIGRRRCIPKQELSRRSP